MALNPGERLGAFEVVSSLGVGGMGEVYLARDSRLGREVAVKVLPADVSRDAERLARFHREARVLASLNHPGIAALYGLEEAGGTPYLVMELVPGETLAERLSRGALPVGEALQVCRQVAEALEAAHAKGVVHRDLKPANIKVTPDGRVKVLDFGLAKAFRGEPSASDPLESPTLTKAATREGVALGTPAYMSPEQARGQTLDKRTDVWSFGCLLYETLTGHRAFIGPTTSDTLVSVLEREPDWGALPRTTPPAVHSLVYRCTRKDREQRLHDIADARIELDEALRGGVSGGSAAVPAQTEFRPRPWRRAALAAPLLVLAAGYLLYAWRSPRQRASPETLSLAVLPFHVVDDPDSKGDLGLGLADDVITHLANLEGLRVRPTRSVLSHRGPAVDVQQAGRALQADSVLSGTVRKTSTGFRVSVQLVRVADGSSYWGDSYDVATEELPGLKDRITEKVTDALGIRPTGPEKARIYGRYTANAAAYEAYLRGRAHLVRSTEEGMAAAAEAFDDALRMDPRYALAHAGLAMASAEMHLRFASAGEVQAWGEAARTQAQRALALDPNLAEVHQALAAVYGKTDFEWDKTIEESHRALELNPRLELPYSFLARAFYHLGLLEAADTNIRAALALDPENRTEPIRAQGIVAILQGRFAEAVPLLEDVRRMSGKPLSDSYLAQAYYYSGDKAGGETVLEELGRTSSASASARARSTLASFLAARGERSRAADLVREVAAGSYMDHHVATSLGAACAQLGRPSEAVTWLRRAAETGFPCHPWYVHDPLLAPLRDHPEFERLLQGLREAQRSAEDRFLRR
ncbi:MAG TPA: protein kinase [Vicinamibacteria bacterium]